jgi:MFS transporter, DHA1 family, multidrug resistance protein
MPAAETPDQTALERRVLVWMCVLVAVNQLGFGAVVPTLALYAQSFGVSASAIGMALAIYGLGRFIATLPAGKLSDSLGRRPTLVIGGVLSALGNLWCAWASTYPEFIAARMVAGAGAGIVVTAGQVVLADISTPERRGRMLAIYQGTFIFAVGIGPFPGGVLAEYYGLAAPFVAYGVACLLVTAVACFAVPETRELSLSRPGAKTGPPMPFGQQLRLFSRNTGFVLASLISLMGAVVRTGGLFAIVPVLITARLGLSVSAIGFALMVGGICGLIAAYPAGWLTDRLGRKAVIVPSTLLAAASMLLFCVATSYAWFLLACIVWSVASSVGSAAPAAFAADSAPPGMNAAAMSTYRATSDIGYVIGPLALGLIVDGYGAVTAIGVAAALLVGITLVFAISAPETHRGGTTG